MANEYAVNQADLKAVADAIRSKGGTSDALTFPGGFVDAVDAIEAGTGGNVAGLVISSVNLHTPETDIPNVYISSTNGAEIGYNGYSASDFIPVTPGKIYFLKDAGDGKEGGHYNENKSFSGIFGWGSFAYQEKNGVANRFSFIRAIGSYIRVSASTSAMAKCEVRECEGDIIFSSSIATSAIYEDDISETMALDILTGGGPEEA